MTQPVNTLHIVVNPITTLPVVTSSHHYLAMRKLLTIFFLLLIPNVSAFANFEEAVNAYNLGDYATAMREWYALAKKGDAKAALAIANQLVSAPLRRVRRPMSPGWWPRSRRKPASRS